MEPWEQSPCPQCGYEMCSCWGDQPQQELPTFSEWHSGDVGRPVVTPADQQRLRALADDTQVSWEDGQVWEMSGLAISHWPAKILSAKALRTFLGL